MSKIDTLISEFDAPWKLAVEEHLEPFLALCFPAVHRLIDWRVTPVFLDTELQQIAPDHSRGARSVDKLVKVRLRNGKEEWLLIHVEIQAQRDKDFAERMWIYYYRIWDRFGQRVISLTVLADDQPDWRPCVYETSLGGCALRFEFPMLKVLDFNEPEKEFEKSGNVFALLIAAHQAALKTRHNAPERCRERFRLVRYLYMRGMGRTQMIGLFRLVSWLTRLPPDFELQFRQDLAIFEQTEKAMELLSPIELMAMEKGREEGREEGREATRSTIVEALETRFGPVSAEARGKVQLLTNEDTLRRGLRLSITASSLENFLENLIAPRQMPT